MKQGSGARDKVHVRNAEQIKRALRRRGMSYREAAFRIGVSAATVSRIANTDGRVIGEGAAIALCRLLDRDFDELFRDATFYVARDDARRHSAA